MSRSCTSWLIGQGPAPRKLPADTCWNHGQHRRSEIGSAVREGDYHVAGGGNIGACKPDANVAGIHKESRMQRTIELYLGRRRESATENQDVGCGRSNVDPFGIQVG